MSRSRKKTPITSITTCCSERKDKKIWHKRLRSRERTALTSVHHKDWDNYLPVLEKQVSNVWSMGKDGKHYWAIDSQLRIAEAIANKKGMTKKECNSIKNRLVHKAMAK